ncbi:hypothetical protein AALA44_04420 [Enterococcus ratti]|uniref:hypothetical protein n=1 Tax=Enterococcus ratti TaxID=150033 RepID=UPI00351723DF
MKMLWNDISQWLKVIQERMGHSNIQTTLNIYNHVTKKAKQNFEKQFANFATFKKLIQKLIHSMNKKKNPLAHKGFPILKK